MKTIALVFCFVFWGAKSLVSAVKFTPGTFSQITEQAQHQHRFILLYMSASWCEPCFEMKQKVFNRPNLEQKLPDFIWVERDGEVGEGAQLVKQYHVVGYPTLLVLDENAQEIDRVMGFLALDDFVRTVRGFRDLRGTVAALEKRLADNPENLTLKFEVASRHAMRGDERAVEELSTIAASPTKNAPAALLVLGKYYYLRGLENYPMAEETLLKLMKIFPGSEEAAQAPYHLAVAYHGMKNFEAAKKVLEEWVAGAPTDIARYNSYAWFCYKHRFNIDRGIEIAKKRLITKHRRPRTMGYSGRAICS